MPAISRRHRREGGRANRCIMSELEALAASSVWEVSVTWFRASCDRSVHQMATGKLPKLVAAKAWLNMRFRDPCDRQP